MAMTGPKPFDRLCHQRAVSEADFNRAGQRRDGRARSVDAAIVSDGLDPVEIVGEGDVGRDDIAECRAVPGDRPIAMTEALQLQLGGRTCARGRPNCFALRHQPRGGGQQARALHLPDQLAEDAARVDRVMDLSRFGAAPGSHLGGLGLEGQGTFPAES